MPAVPPGKITYLYNVSRSLAQTGYMGGHIVYYLLLIFIVLGICRLVWLLTASALQSRQEKLSAALPLIISDYPKISIIVPAYNEQVNIVASLRNLLACSYPNFDVVFVDDGSKDSTYLKAIDAFKHETKLKIFTKPNGGKASALNFGIAHSDADYVICIDADTRLQPDAAGIMMRHFLTQPSNGKIAAIAGNVKVGNEVNMLTRWQSIEYVTSQNFERKAFAYINAITVVPGAIGAFDKQALLEVGGFAVDTLAEDCDLTIRLLKAGYEIKNENQALAFTEVPETLKEFMKQRFRWSFGVMQVFWKNKHTLFNKKFGMFGLLAMPDMLLFKYIIPLFSPLADLLMLVGLLTGNAREDRCVLPPVFICRCSLRRDSIAG